ncbi:MAG: methyltransferase domain-containing protein [Candidatus Omnitrophica bacterium]|nr:methyltransferase domain-containing protein [Candidatus Omnitrophota bacterium]
MANRERGEDVEETRNFWNSAAADWDIQVGEEGDFNRILNSDPVLWDLVGEVEGRTVLDAGCGTGYLTRKLQARGAKAIGVDFSERMIDVARSKGTDIDFRVDSCSELITVRDETIDLIVSNYVLMDVPDLIGTVRAFNRVLKLDGLAVLVFSHPCFPQGRSEVSADGVRYRWDFPYFQHRKCVDPPWGHFTSDFIWFHRPLSDYWKAFVESGFEVVAFEEPQLSQGARHLAKDLKDIEDCQSRPFSVAFKLRKLHSIQEV